MHTKAHIKKKKTFCFATLGQLLSVAGRVRGDWGTAVLLDTRLKKVNITYIVLLSITLGSKHFENTKPI